MKITIFISIFLSLTLINAICADYIEEHKSEWKEFYSEVIPNKTVTIWILPFKTNNRSDIKTISVISTFGSPRYSYLKGHIHTALDLTIKKHKPEEQIFVYPMAVGVVCSVHLGHPHKTVVIKHKLHDGSILFTSYKHFQETYVKAGMQVTPETKLARLYTKKEAKKQGGNYDHLHLEIRKSFDDYGCASWATMTKEELNKRFINPLQFIKENIVLIK